MEFSAFTDADFDAYLDRKWRSNVFNRERLEVKQKLETLGRLLSPILVAADDTPLACQVSVEYPALWNQRSVTNQTLFFSRAEAAKAELEGMISRDRSMAALIEDPSPLHNHVFLYVTLDKAQVELGLCLHADASVDRKNLQRSCQEFFAREKLLGLVHGLPEGFEIGLVGQSFVPTADLDDPGLSDLVARLAEAGTWLAIRRSYPRDEEAVRSERFVDEATAQLAALLPLWQFIAWSRDNDQVGIRETLKQKQVKRQSKGLEPGDRIRVSRGILAGQEGSVESVDGRGRLKVRLGMLPIQLKSEDVTKI